jgi:hypothetical protein
MALNGYAQIVRVFFCRKERMKKERIAERKSFKAKLFFLHFKTPKPK